MSKIGRVPVKIPSDVTITQDQNKLMVKGGKGQLELTIHPLVKLTMSAEEVVVAPADETKFARSLYGTYQRLISNMVTGVSQGFEKTLELVGTGYRVAKQGSKIVLSLGLSHPVEYTAPAGVTVDVEGNNKIIVKGIDKQLVGQVAAIIRSFRSPEPYKGKGIRYQDEVVRRKAGKAAKAG